MFKSWKKSSLATGIIVTLGILPLTACAGSNTTEIVPLGKNNICAISSTQNTTPVPSIIELSLKGMLAGNKQAKDSATNKKDTSKNSPSFEGITEKQLVFLKLSEGGAKIRNLIKDKKCGLVFVTDPTLVAASEEFAYKISKRSGVVPQFLAVVPDLDEKKVYPFNVLKVNLQQPAFIAGFAAASLTRSGEVATLYTDTEQKPRTQAFVKGVNYYNLFTGSGIKTRNQETTYTQVPIEYSNFLESKADMFFYPGVLNPSWGFSGEKNRAKLVSVTPAGKYAIAVNKALTEQKKQGAVYDGTGSLVRLTVNPENYLAEIINLAQAGKPITTIAQLSLVDGGTDYQFDPIIEKQLPDSLKRQLEGIKHQFAEGKLNLSDLN